MGKQGANTSSIAIRVDPEMRKAIERAAKADARPAASLVKKAVAEYLRRNGFLPVDESSAGWTTGLNQKDI
jgi:predicted transcriptional regulator